MLVTSTDNIDRSIAFTSSGGITGKINATNFTPTTFSTKNDN
jgi:hypothetical protein